ncbi:MAG TPA: endonuclease, partial [Cyanothece sp. UBA12306]|nr:endonuclease [Cyanothece sp. UBA12306]
EVYVGLNTQGTQFVIPIQAKGGSDQLGVVQTKQDIAYCQQQFPELICRPVSAQFLDIDLIAMFELVLDDDEIRVREEKHYHLVSNDKISREDLHKYRINNE